MKEASNARLVSEGLVIQTIATHIGTASTIDHIFNDVGLTLNGVIFCIDVFRNL